MNNILINNWGMSSQLILDEAKKLGFETKILSKNKNLFWIKSKKRKYYFKSIDCGLNTAFGLKTTDDKEMTYKIAEENNIKTPKSIYVNKTDLNSFDYKNININYPLVSKPVDGAHGDGVALNLDSSRKLKKGLFFSFNEGNTNRVIIQEQIKGEDHRFLIVGDKVISVAKRISPFVIGNGKNTIEKLIEVENKNPNRGKGHDKIMSYIKIDDEIKTTLKEKGYNLNSILEKDVKINVRKNANLSSGGLAIDMTDNIHKDNINEALKIAKLLGLKICGVDIFSTDITKSIYETNGAIIEVNATPGIRMHHFPSKGKGKNVAKEIISFLIS